MFGILMPYQLSGLIATTVLEGIDIIVISLFTLIPLSVHCVQNKTKTFHFRVPFRIITTLCLQLPSLSYTCTHLFVVTPVICHTVGLNVTFNISRSCILWCEAISKFLEALC